MEKNNSYTNMLSAIENVKDNIARNVSDFFRFSDQLSNALDTLNQILGILYSSELTDMCQRSSQIISSASKGFTATTELSHFMQGFFASIGQNTNIQCFHTPQIEVSKKGGKMMACTCKPKRKTPMTVRVKKHKCSGSTVNSHRRHMTKLPKQAKFC